MNAIWRQIERNGRWLAILLLCFLWLRLLNTAVVKSDTFDEMFHVLSGSLYWQNDSLEPILQNPPLISAIIGLPVSLLFHPNIPLDDPLWPTGNWLRTTQLFLWQANDNGWQLLWVGRLVTISLALLLSALLYSWGRQASHRRLPGLLALLFVSFDPNILAHGSLATADIGMALFLSLAVCLVWRYWRMADEGTATKAKIDQAYLLAAVGIGCVLASKFSGLVLLPALCLLAAYRWLVLGAKRPSWQRVVAELLGWFFIAGLLFLIIYRFDFAALAADFSRQQEHQLTGHSTYLLGQLGQEGWWYYFPVIFAAKTPLPVLALLFIAVVLFVKNGRFHWSLLWLLLVAGGIGAASLISHVNIGYRYLLPALPLLYLFIALELVQPTRLNQASLSPHFPTYGSLLLLWVIIESLFIHPDYLAYFNQLAGGPENGWRVALDSNIDWGQDIRPLSRYLQAHQMTEPIYAAWLGTAPLAAYGIKGISLPAWPVAPQDMLYSPFYPPRPAPGLYVLSVTQLQGVYLDDPQRFAWFQEREPDDKVGYSLFVYEVPADGPPTEVAISGLGLDSVSPTDFEQSFGSNDVSLRWYDARRAFLWPSFHSSDTASSWSAVGDGHLPDQPILRAMYPAATLSGQGMEDLHYQLFHWIDSPIMMAMDRAEAAQHLYTDFGWSPQPVIAASEWATSYQPLPGEANFSDTFQLLGYEMDEAAISGDNLQLITYWRVRDSISSGQVNSPKIFLHLLDATGQVVAQNDGLDINTAGLKPGDELAQLHELVLPGGFVPGSYALQLGLYEAEDGHRLTVPISTEPVDRLLLRSFQLESP